MYVPAQKKHETGESRERGNPGNGKINAMGETDEMGGAAKHKGEIPERQQGEGSKGGRVF